MSPAQVIDAAVTAHEASDPDVPTFGGDGALAVDALEAAGYRVPRPARQSAIRLIADCHAAADRAQASIGETVVAMLTAVGVDIVKVG